eukprot:scaffold70359_cov46-Tisochrysis_lutea.AAC.1
MDRTVPELRTNKRTIRFKCSLRIVQYIRLRIRMYTPPRQCVKVSTACARAINRLELVRVVYLWHGAYLCCVRKLACDLEKLWSTPDSRSGGTGRRFPIAVALCGVFASIRDCPACVPPAHPAQAMSSATHAKRGHDRRLVIKGGKPSVCGRAAPLEYSRVFNSLQCRSTET